MNLGEWLASEEFKMPTSSELVDQIPEDVNTFYDTYTKSEAAPAPQPTSMKALRVTPTEIVSETAVSLEAIGYWPFVGQGNDNKVSNLHVDWGDGTTINIPGSAMGTDNLLRASHTYAKPEQDGTIVVQATFTAQDGQHVVTSNISAFRNTASPSTQKQGGGLIESTSGTVPSMFPGGADGNSVPR